ncbi:MAG: hypothetical protein AAF828_07800 [Bacteroidota bacterium]
MDTLLALYYPDLPNNDYLAIARKPEGYFVGIHAEGEVYPQTYHPFWLAGEQKLQPLPFRRRDREVLPHYNTENVGYWKAPQFDRHLYYGYPDFTKDVFAALEGLATLSTEQQQQLARAHAEHAMNLLNNQFGTSDPAMRFKLDEAQRERLDAQQLSSYLIHINEAAKHYGALPARWPTPVGDASTKYQHQIITAYLSLLQYATPTDAAAIVRQYFGGPVATETRTARAEGYDAHLLFCSRLLLESCPQNAILITEGDNDTYPLLYLQLVENFRPDILVVNRHLLHLPRYVEVLRAGQQIGGSLQLSQDMASIQAWESQQFLPGPRQTLIRPQAVEKVLNGLTRLPVSATEPVARLPFGAIQLSSKTDGPLFRPETPLFHSGDLVMLDLIASNFNQRPIAVAVTINEDYFAYSNSWQQIGLVYNLGDEKPAYHIDLNGTIAWSALLSAPKRFDYIGEQSRFYLSQLEYLLLDVGYYLDRINETTTAIDLVDRYIAHAQSDQIFNKHHYSRILHLMHQLGYDPNLVSAYVGMTRESLLTVPLAERPPYYQERLRYLQHYLLEGEFPHR